MKNTKEIVNKYKCNWLDSLLKELIRNKDFKTYNRIKCVVYYFPDVLNNASKNDFEIAFKYVDDTYITIGQNDNRYLFLDRIYKKTHNGQDFEPSPYYETRYITIGEMCKYFNI